MLPHSNDNAMPILMKEMYMIALLEKLGCAGFSSSSPFSPRPQINGKQI
jgi:hypothetical protein